MRCIRSAICFLKVSASSEAVNPGIEEAPREFDSIKSRRGDRRVQATEESPSSDEKNERI